MSLAGLLLVVALAALVLGLLAVVPLGAAVAAAVLLVVVALLAGRPSRYPGGW